MFLLEQDKPIRSSSLERTNAESESQSSIKDKLLEAYKNGERKFQGWKLDHLDLSGCQLSDGDFSECSFEGSDLTSAILRRTNLSKADFSEATLSRAVLVEADLSWAKLSRASLVGADMRRCTARAANFTDALLLRARLNDSDCLGANFSHINATAAQFESANLECADISHATMMNASLYGANCSWANFCDTRLNWANLSWSLLEAADMENANLTGANICAANLNFSNLSGAIFTGADLYFANLSGAQIPENALSAARVSSARLTNQTFSRSKWPKELLRDWQQRGAIILDFSDLPENVQSFIKQGECNLRIFFSISIDAEYQIALETLIYHHLGRDTGLRILSIATERNRSQVAFYASNPSEIETFCACLENRSWKSEAASIVDHFSNIKSPVRAQKFDIIHALTVLSDHILQIQALIPSSDDQMQKYHAQIAPDERIEERTQISWSSVSQTKISR